MIYELIFGLAIFALCLIWSLAPEPRIAAVWPRFWAWAWWPWRGRWPRTSPRG